MITEKVNQALKMHCYDGWPRRVGFPKQSIYHTSDHFVSDFWVYNGYARGVYPAVFPDHIAESRKYNKFYFDLDNELDLNQAYNDMREIDLIMIKYFDVDIRVYFSGGKGFAVYLDLEGEHVFKDYPIVHKRLSMFLKEHGITSLDEAIIGDTSRISRAPFNIHPKGRLCIPIQLCWSFNEVFIQSHNYNHDFIITIERADEYSEGFKMLREWDDTAQEFRNNIRKEVASSGFTGNFPLESLMTKSPKLIGYRRVLMYRLIVPQMMRQGFGRDDIHQYCSEFVERSNEEYNHESQKFVDYYINFNSRKDWAPISTYKLFMEHPELVDLLLN